MRSNVGLEKKAYFLTWKKVSLKVRLCGRLLAGKCTKYLIRKVKIMKLEVSTKL